MLYHLLFPLRNKWGVLNVFQYISFRSIYAAITALILIFIVAPFIIRKLQEHKVGQYIRHNGPAEHHRKAGTPTMGGIMVLLAVILSTVIWARWDNRFVILILLVTIWFGGLGFLDDYLKLIRKHSGGLPARYKLLGQIIGALGMGIYLYLNPSNPEWAHKLAVPFFKGVYLELGWFYVVFVMLVVVGSSNAVNLTDGLDGLATGCIIFATLGIALMTYVAGHSEFSRYLGIVKVTGSGELTVYLASLAGAALAFLWYNAYPTEIFMGDTGSLAIGAALGTIAVIIKQELVLVIIGGIFVVEAISVILQVLFYRMKKQRIFNMAPLHHHFELAGWKEPKIVIRFWIIAIVLFLLSLSTLKLR